MNKAIIIFLFSIINISTFAQQIVKESIDSGGGVATATGIKIVHTLGEVVVAEKNNGTLHVSEGFISADFANYLEVENYTELVGIKAYPNPTASVLHIHFSEPQNYQIQIFDMLGKELMLRQSTNTSNYELDVTKLQAASYVVLVKNTDSRQFKTFRIIKMN